MTPIFLGVVAADHVEVDVGHDLVVCRQVHVIGEPFAAQQPFLFAGDPEKRHAAGGSGALTERLGDFQQRAGARRVIVRAVVDFALFVDTDMIVMCAEDDDLFLLFGIGAGEEADHIAIFLVFGGRGEPEADTHAAAAEQLSPWYRRSGRTPDQQVADRVGQGDRGQACRGMTERHARSGKSEVSTAKGNFRNG